MNFLAPAAFFFAAAIPVVIVFYLLKRKRVVKLVSSTLLWQRFLAETQANAPFQRLRHNWLLLLQILLLALAVLALSRPYLSAKTQGGRLQVVILDASASMQSTDESPSRFEKARSEALQMVDAMHDNDAMVVLQAAANTEVKQSATSHKTALRRALHSCRVTDASTHLREALKLAETLVQNQPRAEIHLFSDGAVGSLDEFENSALPLSYHRLGQGSDNLAVTALDVRPNPENAAQRAIFASVSNFSTNRRPTTVELRFNEQLLEVKTVTLEPKQTLPLVFVATQTANTGVFTARLTTHDALPVDDQASVVSVLPLPVKVLLVTAGDLFLEKALRAAPNVRLTVVSTLTDSAPGFDVVVLDNVVPQIWPKGNTLAFHVASTNWFPAWSKLEAPPIVSVRTSHQLLRFVALDNVQVAESLAVSTPDWGTALVEAPQNPLMVAGELGRQRLVWIAFDLLQSTWPLRVSFPIFVANAVDWLNPSGGASALLTVQTGSPFRIPWENASSNAVVTLPGGDRRSIQVNPATGELVIGDTLKQGIYRISAGTNETIFCANLLSAAESDITPKDELKLGKYAKATATQVRPASLELWRGIAAVALLVLLSEWWYYHRRTV